MVHLCIHTGKTSRNVKLWSGRYTGSLVKELLMQLKSKHLFRTGESSICVWRGGLLTENEDENYFSKA